VKPRRDILLSYVLNNFHVNQLVIAVGPPQPWKNVSGLWIIKISKVLGYSIDTSPFDIGFNAPPGALSVPF